MREQRCFFTGHRIISNKDKEILEEKLKSIIAELLNDGVKEFCTGGALGFDYMAAQAILEYKKTNPDIKLRIFLPCYGSEKKWSSVQKFYFNMLKVKSDSVEYVSQEKYYDGCMQKRNEVMADFCGICVAFCKNSRSGTKKAMSYAQSIGCKIINISL